MNLAQILKQKQLPERSENFGEIKNEMDGFFLKPKMKKAFKKMIKFIRKHGIRHASWDAEYGGTIYRLLIIEEYYDLISPEQPGESQSKAAPPEPSQP